MRTLACPALLFLLVAGCGQPAGDNIVCDPVCPAGTHCTAGGCVVDGPAPDLAASQADAGGACSPACSGATPYCNTNHVCVPCLMDSHCPPGNVCRTLGQASACVAGCSDDSRCAGAGGDGGAGSMKCCGGQCIDVSSDIVNCGQCGTGCSAMHAGAVCSGGACRPGQCDPGWGDCNHDPKDGCEANLHVDATNCGACGTACAFPNATAACSDGCYVGACNFGWDDCDGDPKNGCETSVLSDVKNCGGCAMPCPMVPHASSACSNATCQLAACNQGFADCDGDPKNGCEVGVGSDVNNCGACGNACGNGQVCVNGGCTCKQCSIPNAKTKCVNLMCVFDSCLPGFADCNQNLVDGCEVDLTSDPKNCNSCGNLCPMNLPACVMSACSNAGKCSDVATAYCKQKGWVISQWNGAFPGQPGGSIFCVAPGHSAADDCDTCQTYNQLVWKNVAKDACGSGEMLMPGKAYGGHSPCLCQPNLLDCGNWPMMGCIPD